MQAAISRTPTRALPQQRCAAPVRPAGRRARAPTVTVRAEHEPKQRGLEQWGAVAASAALGFALTFGAASMDQALAANPDWMHTPGVTTGLIEKSRETNRNWKEGIRSNFEAIRAGANQEAVTRPLRNLRENIPAKVQADRPMGVPGFGRLPQIGVGIQPQGTATRSTRGDYRPEFGLLTPPKLTKSDKQIDVKNVLENPQFTPNVVRGASSDRLDTLTGKPKLNTVVDTMLDKDFDRVTQAITQQRTGGVQQGVSEIKEMLQEQVLSAKDQLQKGVPLSRDQAEGLKANLAQIKSMVQPNPFVDAGK